MKRIIPFVLVLFMLACASQKSSQIQSSKSTKEVTRDGSSFEKAIIVSSVNEEYEWAKQHYPGSRLRQQSLVFNNRKPFDILVIITADGTEKKIHFDIHKFYGKF